MQNFFVEGKKSGSPGPRVSIGSHSSRKKKEPNKTFHTNSVKNSETFRIFSA